MNIQKILSIGFVLLVILKYVFQVKIHEKYLFFLTSILVLSTHFGSKSSAIEMFDGSTVAFDKEAFENLNRVVNEIAGEGKLTIPGNLIVKGTTVLEGDTTLEKKATIKGTTSQVGKLSTNDIEVALGKQFHCRGMGHFLNQKKQTKWTTINHSDGHGYFRGDVKIDGSGGTSKNLLVKGTSIFEGMIDSSKNGIRVNNILAPPMSSITVKNNTNFTGSCKVGNRDVIRYGDDINIGTYETDDNIVKILYDSDAGVHGHTSANFSTPAKDAYGSDNNTILRIAKVGSARKGTEIPWTRFGR